MARYEREETIVLSCTVKDSDGALQDAATSMKVTVYDPDGTAVVDAESMTKDSTGTYHYDYTPDSSTTLGTYRVEYVAVDGTRTTITKDAFELISRSGPAAYAAPGMTVSEIEQEIADAMAWDTSVAAQLARIDKAVSMAGHAAATYEGTDWWWLHATSSFDTVDGTASYALRTVNDSAMEDLWAVEHAYYDDDWRLRRISWADYRDWYVVLQTTTNESKPYEYAVSGDGPTMYLKPTPDDAYTIYVSYIKRHGKITSAGSTDSALIVPGEFHWPVYVDGALWLLRHEVLSPVALSQSGAFRETMRQMLAARPHSYDPNTTTALGLPHNQRYDVSEDGWIAIGNPPSLN